MFKYLYGLLHGSREQEKAYYEIQRNLYSRGWQSLGNGIYQPHYGFCKFKIFFDTILGTKEFRVIDTRTNQPMPFSKWQLFKLKRRFLPIFKNFQKTEKEEEDKKRELQIKKNAQFFHDFLQYEPKIDQL